MRTHKCAICGKVGEWGLGWSWFGSEKENEDGDIIIKVCCDKCMKEAKKKYDI